MNDYDQFLNTKVVATPASGIEVDGSAIHPLLFDWQAEVVRWALSRSCAALFEDCGLGKTVQQLEWSRHVQQHTGGTVLICAPLAVSQQTIAEARKIGLSVSYARRQADTAVPGLYITNYERLKDFDLSRLSGIVLDECFPAGTPIDTPNGAVPIEKVRIGDAILNAAGIDVVGEIHTREVPYAVRITTKRASFVTSPNHPIFTQRGWVGAQDLKPGDYALETRAAMSLVRDSVFPGVPREFCPEVLRDILLSEMADAAAGNPGEGSQSGSGSQAWAEEECLVRVGQSGSRSGTRADTESQSDGEPRDSPEMLHPIESHEPQTFRAWGERAWFDSASTDTSGCTREELDSGICFVVGQTNSRLSHALQDRLGESRAHDRYRGGWTFPPESEGAGPQERGEAGFSRVDSLEVLELGHPDLERLRDANGKLYFYDLGATRHPSFSVAGLLVHNSSVLKNYMGTTRRLLTAECASIPFRLCCTATPAPNDHMELGQHAEFLGIMPASEMLMRWFINDTMHFGQYRLKGHAVNDFWKWVASWAICCSTPADLGYSAEGFDLPPLRMERHLVEVDLTAGAAPGSLFRNVDLSATSIHREMRLTTDSRSRMVADLVNGSDEIWAVWCNTNYEADALKPLIPDAVEVRGSDSLERKEERLQAFSSGQARVIISKPGIAGYGLNWQHCHNVCFTGLSYSYEDLYQALRRCWRFGQKSPVNAHIVMAETEQPVFDAIQRKQQQHLEMQRQVYRTINEISRQERVSLRTDCGDQKMQIPGWLVPEQITREAA